MRVLLWFLLCLTIPVQGVAAAHAFKHPCPMEQAGHTMMMEAADAEGDCCNDPVTVVKTGKLCKAGQECPVSGSCLPALTATSTSPRVASRAVAFPRPFLLLLSPASVWRPPALN